MCSQRVSGLSVVIETVPSHYQTSRIEICIQEKGHSWTSGEMAGFFSEYEFLIP